jgi:S-layer homology domain
MSYLFEIGKIAVQYKLITFSGEECTRKIMNQKKQQIKHKQVKASYVSSLLLGSVVSGALLSGGAAMAETAPAKLTATNPIATAIDNKNSSQTVATPANNQIAQSALSDVAGNWAEPFIRVLAEKNIIVGYPDGTYKPDQPVTRAEFAAMLNKAFDLQSVRGARKFKDVPSKHWAASVIQKAYQSGFLAGYPNGTFAPNQNIIRIQSLVSLINGNKLEPSGTLDLNGVYGDAASVPSYGQNALIAGTQRCVSVSFDYDSGKLPGGNFNPNQIATRADVAAFVHQVLVASGKLTALDKSSPANKFIASCPQGVYVTKIDAAPVAVTADQAISQLSIPGQVPPVTGTTAVTTLPVGGLSTPNAFGANWGDFFVGASYQDRTRPAVFSTPAGTVAGGTKTNLGVGLGLGDARNFLGLEAVANFSDGNSDLLSRGTADFKIHKLLGDNFAIAGGWERALDWGDNANTLQTQSTGYGVASVVLNPDSSAGFFSNTTLSIGAGAGRFRSIGDIRTNSDTINVFGSIGTRLSPNFSLVADWNGQDLGVGLPITIPFGGGASFQVTPALVDLTNSETGGSRFVVGGGLGLRF